VDDKRIQYDRKLVAGIVALLALLGGICGAAEVVVSGRITYEAADGVYVNVGTDRGLSQGVAGSLRLDDGQTLQFEVLHAARQSAMLRLTNRPANQSLVNKTVELAFEQAAVTDKSEQAKPVEPKRPGDANAFVPLLAPVRQPPEVTGSENVSHGRVQVRQMAQTDSKTGLDYWVTRFSSSGTVDRIQGSPWSFQWSGDARYRDGAAYSSSPDYRAPRLDMYEAVFQRSFEDEGFLRLGRFLPQELPGIGYVDGLQGEVRHDDHWRFGAAAGLAPDRINLEPSGNEPLVAGYTTYEAGTHGEMYYSGTAGLMSSMYRGRANRLALLFDQRADLGPRLTLYSTTAVDFDIGAVPSHHGTRLTRTDLGSVYQAASWLDFRAGVDHWERPDNPSERDLIGINDNRYFDSGYWRYWVGSDQALPWNLRFSEEVGFINADTGGNSTHWRLGVTRTDLFGLPSASVTATVFNLAGDGIDGYGGRLSAYLPLIEHRLSLQPMIGFRMLQTDPQSQDFTVDYVSLRVDGQLSKNWTLFGDIVYTTGDNVDAKLFDVGLRFAW
jgi:hypothetical protein